MKEGQRSRTKPRPNFIKIYDFANIGASEPFVARIMLELPRALEGTRLSDGQKRGAKEAILAIGAEGLMPALENLRAIRSIPDQPNLPEMNRRQNSISSIIRFGLHTKIDFNVLSGPWALI